MNVILDAPACSPVKQTAAPVNPPRILVVDDDVHLRRLEADLLKSAGHRVETAEDGLKAWQVLQSRVYDLLVTDFSMPGLSGLALVHLLRRASIALPVVMVSGALDSLDIEGLTRDPWARIHAFVRKPFTRPELLLAVSRALTPESL